MAGRDIWIALVDDWELRGNGRGDVRTLQFEPAMRLMDCYEELGVTASFNVEVMQQMAFERLQHRHPELAAQGALWVKTVEEFTRRGFDVQFHLHPQWHDADYDGARWRLARCWNIGRYPPDLVAQFVEQGLAFLSNFVPRQDLLAFRAGAWGVGPPSRPLFEALARNGIKIDVSIVAGLACRGESITIDYRRLESPYRPYYPDFDDARKVANAPADLVEIPTQSVPVNRVLPRKAFLQRAIERARPFVRMARGLAEASRRVLSGRAGDPFEPPISPLGAWMQSDFIIDFARRRPMKQWFRALDIVMARAEEAPKPAFLVFENHTKGLGQDADFDRVRRIVRHIQTNHGERVRFVQLKDMARSLHLLQLVVAS